MIEEDFNTIKETNEFVLEYENWLDEVVQINSSPNYDYDMIHIEED
jgi:hypothetical protein